VLACAQKIQRGSSRQLRCRSVVIRVRRDNSKGAPVSQAQCEAPEARALCKLGTGTGQHTCRQCVCMGGYKHASSPSYRHKTVHLEVGAHVCMCRGGSVREMVLISNIDQDLNYRSRPLHSLNVNACTKSNTRAHACAVCLDEVNHSCCRYSLSAILHHQTVSTHNKRRYALVVLTIKQSQRTIKERVP